MSARSRDHPKPTVRIRQCAGSERDEVRPARLVQVVQMQWKERQAVEALEGFVTFGHQATNVLSTDLGVGADVDDVDSPDTLLLEPLERTADHSSGDQRLAESHLVCHQKSRATLLEQHAVNVRRRAALEVLQSIKRVHSH